MKKIFLVMIFLFFTHNLNAIEEGKEYIALKNPIPNTPNSVVELFNYACIYCYKHHEGETLAKIKQKLPNMDYFSIPIKFGAYGSDFARLYVYAITQDDKNKLDATSNKGLGYKLKDAYFTAVFKRRMNWNNGANPIAFYEIGYKIMGINKSILDDFMSKTQAITLFNSFDDYINIASQSGTPAYIINGKYQIILENIDSLDHFIDTIIYLSKLK